jgi:hypothetical protein
MSESDDVPLAGIVRRQQAPPLKPPVDSSESMPSWMRNVRLSRKSLLSSSSSSSPLSHSPEREIQTRNATKTTDPA